MDGRPTWTYCDEAGEYVVPNVLSPRELVFRPDDMDETVTQTLNVSSALKGTHFYQIKSFFGGCISKGSQYRIIHNENFKFLRRLHLKKGL